MEIAVIGTVLYNFFNLSIYKVAKRSSDYEHKRRRKKRVQCYLVGMSCALLGLSLNIYKKTREKDFELNLNLKGRKG